MNSKGEKGKSTALKCSLKYRVYLRLFEKMALLTSEFRRSSARKKVWMKNFIFISIRDSEHQLKGLCYVSLEGWMKLRGTSER